MYSPGFPNPSPLQFALWEIWISPEHEPEKTPKQSAPLDTERRRRRSLSSLRSSGCTGANVISVSFHFSASSGVKFGSIHGFTRSMKCKSWAAGSFSSALIFRRARFRSTFSYVWKNFSRMNGWVFWCCEMQRDQIGSIEWHGTRSIQS